MNTDDFEKRLQRQTPRQIPVEWRAEIINAVTKHRRDADARASGSPLNWPAILWRELIWPSRRIWASFAAAWLVIATVNLREGRGIQLASHDFTPPSPAVLVALREPERWLAEFAESRETADADRPKKTTPLPHSQWHGQRFQA